MEIGDHSLHDVIAVSRRNDNLGGSYQSVHIPAVEIFDDVAERLSRVYFFTSQKVLLHLFQLWKTQQLVLQLHLQ
jgi:hypothetical protein